MALTTQTLNSGDSTEIKIITSTETGTSSAPISTSVAIDYSVYLSMIVNALESIAVSTTAMASHQQKLRELAEGNGIRTIDPYNLISVASNYAYYNENIADLNDLIARIQTVAPSTTTSLNQLKTIVATLPKLP